MAQACAWPEGSLHLGLGVLPALLLPPTPPTPHGSPGNVRCFPPPCNQECSSAHADTHRPSHILQRIPSLQTLFRRPPDPPESIQVWAWTLVPALTLSCGVTLRPGSVSSTKWPCEAEVSRGQVHGLASRGPARWQGLSPAGSHREANSRPSSGLLSPIPEATAQEPFKGFSHNSALDRMVPSRPCPPRFQQPFSVSSAGHGQARRAGLLLQPLSHSETVTHPSPHTAWTAGSAAVHGPGALQVIRLKQATVSPSQGPAPGLSTLPFLAPSWPHCVVKNTRNILAGTERQRDRHGG